MDKEESEDSKDPVVSVLEDSEYPDCIGSVQGGPTIVRLGGQRFKFEGQGGAWYAKLAAESLQWNMKFHKFSDCPKCEKIYVTGISIQICESRRLVHNVIIRVREEDSFFLGCIEGDGGVCLGEGSFKAIVN